MRPLRVGTWQSRIFVACGRQNKVIDYQFIGELLIVQVIPKAVV